MILRTMTFIVVISHFVTYQLHVIHILSAFLDKNIVLRL